MNAWAIEFKPQAQRTLSKLPKGVQRQIAAALERYALTGAGKVIHLTNRPGEYRLRVGDYRVVFERHNDRLVILVLKVGHRSSV